MTERIDVPARLYYRRAQELVVVAKLREKTANKRWAKAIADQGPLWDEIKALRSMNLDLKLLRDFEKARADAAEKRLSEIAHALAMKGLHLS